MPYNVKEIADSEAERLCRLARGGDNEAFESLYALVLPLIKTLASRLNVKRVIEPEDAAQQLSTLFRYEVVDTYDASRGKFAGFAAYVMRRKSSSIFNQSLKTKRKKFLISQKSYNDIAPEANGRELIEAMADPRASAPGAQIAEEGDRVELSERMREVLKTLSPLEREVLKLRLESGGGMIPIVAHLTKGRRTAHMRDLDAEQVKKVVDNALERIKVKVAKALGAEAEKWVTRRRKKTPPPTRCSKSRTRAGLQKGSEVET